jgi:hypothetical protein
MAISIPEHRNSFGRASTFPARWRWLGRAWYALRAVWRHVRISRLATRVLGPQYRRSRDRIEIDITYLCNLHCLNCNRSVRQAREALHMPLDRVRQFVDDSIGSGKRWSRIRVLGGEPTLHPEFLGVVEELRRYRAWHPECLVEVVTNGHGPRVQARLQRLPPDVWVENSRKLGAVQPSFGPFNLAPMDDPAYRHADFTNGCAIMHDCGMGLTPLGYYPCAVAGGIDRITGDRLGRAGLPDDGDDMQAALRELCRLCGRFRDGHYVPRNLRPSLEEERISPTWRRLYAQWHQRRRGARA